MRFVLESILYHVAILVVPTDPHVRWSDLEEMRILGRVSFPSLALQNALIIAGPLHAVQRSLGKTARRLAPETPIDPTLLRCSPSS